MKISQSLRAKIKQQVILELKKEEKKSAVLITSYAFTDKEVNDIIEILPFLRGCEIEKREDKSIIAGFIVSWGSKILDVSLAGRLDTVTAQVSSI
ncbi:MAG TPA: F0F1 ATP synthase subunit delta [Patescibacteria group bacterium]|nr:F0F1 ATP synthase subunit delta [Patescibacteria group bacterium]